MSTPIKQHRQNLIRRIISEREISSQHELRGELLRHSVDATQATISRDISELGLIKNPALGTYQLREAMSTAAENRRFLEELRLLVREIVWSGNLVLLKTAPGDAQAAGERFDNLRFKEAAGTLAGDDTLLVVVREQHRAASFAGRLEKLIRQPGRLQ
jgi:transcriptional regulator of arginine metabolism